MASTPLIALSSASAFLQADGAKQDAEAKAQAAEYNAQVGQVNSQFALKQAAEQERIQRAQSEQQIGNSRADYGASGVSSASGSALEVLAFSASNAERDALNIRNAGNMKAWSYQAGANLDTAAASNARAAGAYGVANAIFGGLTKMAPAIGGGGGGSSSLVSSSSTTAGESGFNAGAIA